MIPVAKPKRSGITGGKLGDVMANRWLILFVLFLARTSMAFQYQSAAALSPLVADNYFASLADIGFLIGLYLGPGIVVAIPGGSLAARFGDRRVVALSLGAMLVGGALMAVGEAWWLLLVGRLLAGAGGVAVNVVMTKMVIDWFASREIGTAMGVFISSWPLGIALALMILPRLAEAGGLTAGWLGVVVAIAVALGLFLCIYQTAPGGSEGPSLERRAFPVLPLSLAAGIWALFNTALAMVFGFGPLLLTEQGNSLTSASETIGVFTLAVGVATPLGGILSDRFGRDRVIFISLAASVVSLPLLVFLSGPLIGAVHALAGFVLGIGAGPVVSMTSQILPPNARAFGMGVYYTIYYAVMMVGPAAGGAVADLTGTASAAYYLGALFMAVCMVFLVWFRRIAAPVTA